MPVDPVVRFVEPRASITLLSPRTHRRRGNLLLRVFAEKLWRGDEADRAFRALPQNGLEKIRALKPPVAEQLRIVGRGGDRGAVFHFLREGFKLSFSSRDEIRSMCHCLPLGPSGLVWLLSIRWSGNTKVLKAGVLPLTGCLNVRAHVRVLEVPADVPIELAVFGVRRVTKLGAPYLLRAFRIPAKRRHPGLGVDRRVDTIHRLRIAVHQSVGIDEKEANPLLSERLFEPRKIAALRQPDSGRPATKSAEIVAHPDGYLGTDALWLIPKERQESMSRRAGDDFEVTGL